MNRRREMSPGAKRFDVFASIKAETEWLEAAAESGGLPEKAWPRNHAEFRQFEDTELGFTPWVNTTLTSPKGRYADWGRRAMAAISLLKQREQSLRRSASPSNRTPS